MAIFLPPIYRDGLDSFLGNFFSLLFFLAHALVERLEEFGLPGGINYPIKYLRFLRGSTLDSFDVSRNLVTTSLVQGLGIQVRAGDGDVDGDGTRIIKEMVALCRELLTSDLSVSFPDAAFRSLNAAADAEFDRGLPIKLLDEIVQCLRDAVKVCPPNSYIVFVALANQLHTRFMTRKTHSLDDYEEATALLENILEPNRSGGCPDSVRGFASRLAAGLAFSRCTYFPNPEYSEVAISRIRAELGSPSLDEVGRFNFSEMLSTLVKGRFRDYSLSENLEEASSQVDSLLSSQTVVEKSGMLLTHIEDVQEAYSMTALQQKIRYLEELLSNTPLGTERHTYCLSHLADWYKSKFRRTNDTSDIDESIKYARLCFDGTHANDPWRIIHLSSLYKILLLAFENSGKIGYLDESITIGHDILELGSPPNIHIGVVQTLVTSLIRRENLLGRIEDRHEAIRLTLLVINNPHASESERFRLSCQWAIIARNIGHSTTLTAYKSAMSLMQSSLSFAPTVSVQHACLVAMGEDCQTMPLDYASYQIKLGQFEEAVETLEQGRALLWSEMRGLRIPVTQLISEDSLLAQRFTQINQELEALTIAVTPSGTPEMEDGIGDGTDPFGRLVIKRQKLVNERDALISQIQSQGGPGLGELLKVPSFTTLRCAASRGPVIIINHCQWRSDIIIIFHNSLPCSIPTAETFFACAISLQDELIEARKKGLDSVEYQDALCSVLKGLYELVGEPVIKRLRLLGVPEQSRIWWCPTSVFCSLPLHAMGPIPSRKGHEQYFSDLYIPSYTPSLCALIESRQTRPQVPKRPSLLLVAQPDDSLPGVNEEIKVIQQVLQARLTITGLVSGEAAPSAVLEGL